jgi:oxalate---CoA ligase
VERGSASPAIAVAARRGVPVVELVEDEAAGAGAFRLEATGPVAGTARLPGRAEPDDVALVLHTSGTTSRPKIVPLSHRNVCASARHVVATLSLQPDDVCLNVMPLFHIHGLIAAVLASLAAGGAVVCTPGFNALKFFGWLDEARPTWYTAVPTMHQAILGRADRNQDTIRRARLRFIRSSSASLPPQVMAALEAAFGAPVIESYGMTEAAHQMTSNSLLAGSDPPCGVGDCLATLGV